MNLQKLRILNGNALKLIAAFFMLVDHVGFLFIPANSPLYWVMRSIGRLAMPLFAYMIAEGCRYTKNKISHFTLIFATGILCSLVYYFFDAGSLQLCILITFSFSILMIYALQYMKQCFLLPGHTTQDKVISTALFLSSVLFTYCFCGILPMRAPTFDVDYGFWGAMLPVFVSLFDFKDLPLPEKFLWLDCYLLRILSLGIGILCLCAVGTYDVIGHTTVPTIEYFALLALPLLLLYNGQKGKKNLKYFFYLFYPLHLVALEAIYVVLAVILLK